MNEVVRCVFRAYFLAALPLSAQTLPGTGPLEPNPDFSAAMVAGIDAYALRLTDASKDSRKPSRERLKAIIGAADERLPVRALDLAGTTDAPALVYESESARVYRVRWPVFEGVHGEGLYVQPKGRPLARVVLLPDADETPESLAEEALLASGCEVVIPAPVSRDASFSSVPRFGIRTNIPHREWIYRQAYELGRHIIGYEVQKTLALVDWLKAQPEQAPVLVAGRGEGGLVALYAAAVDPRIDAACVRGTFGPREGVWQEPIYRNVFGLLRDFGDAEIASLVAPRPLVVQHTGFPEVTGPPAAKPGERAIAAPGRLTAVPLAAAEAEVARAKRLAPGAWIRIGTRADGIRAVAEQVFGLPPAQAKESGAGASGLKPDDTRQERLVRELESFTQRLIADGERERDAAFWKRLPLGDAAAFERFTAAERERFWNEVIGRLPDPDAAVNAKSRLVKETDKVAIWEVTLDVWPGVFAWGWLCLPKDLKAGERRPVVVCQHGLEGLPEDTVTEDRATRAWQAYQAFALRLAEEGFVTFAPHNPYRGKDSFRTLQRKLNPLGLTLYSVINGQHQRLLEWLKAQPFARPDRIAFYGLSYGGKSAMRTPAVLTDYCLSICSGDFNEWIRKCVSTDLPMSYLGTGEYEIWEWNMGRTFSYAEMAALIAPRLFMVERGHRDGVGLDEWVDYEYAKVRRLYDTLQIGGRTEIEHFDGPHTIHGVGTFEFLRNHLLTEASAPRR